eukprot:CAMPEP_0180117592 /NCGR_PEP_ID=MMETSP0986-20121125/1000_1 /TAXON_ID=697907 /ORGANISM="non described non described, Strain CCMP2293" /LENGTH=115 /DNA_ID=CAMNT_0022056475 /DNA_START=37 /DNA_END=381 /DNA_ORIENTATION=-
MTATPRAERRMAALSTAATKPLSVPKGEGRRGEGLRTAERQSGTSCTPDFYDRCSEVDSSQDGHLPSSLSECAFFMEDAFFEQAGAAPEHRSTHSETEDGGDDSTFPSPTDATDW